MWKLDEKHCSTIPKNKGEVAIVTFTDYNKNIYRDTTMLKIINRYYKEIYVWPQGSGDFDYVKTLSNITKVDVKFLPANLKLFDKFLSSADKNE